MSLLFRDTAPRRKQFLISPMAREMGPPKNKAPPAHDPLLLENVQLYKMTVPNLLT
jgi:hypothetical protein